MQLHTIDLKANDSKEVIHFISLHSPSQQGWLLRNIVGRCVYTFIYIQSLHETNKQKIHSANQPRDSTASLKCNMQKIWRESFVLEQNK